MGKYLDLFPKVLYNIEGKTPTDYQLATNLLFRLSFLRSVLGNIAAYYEYTITDSDTPEILAEKVYGDIQSHWVILLANDIVDPQYDWPLDGRSFKKYLKKKYGNIDTIKTIPHHFEKVVIREEVKSGIITETRFIINQTRLTENELDVPFDYYEGAGSLPETQESNTYNLEDGRTVIETIRRDTISIYDYEHQQNEAKRQIKIIKPEYFPQIQYEFNEIMKNPRTPFLRRLT